MQVRELGCTQRGTRGQPGYQNQNKQNHISPLNSSFRLNRGGKAGTLNCDYQGTNVWFWNGCVFMPLCHKLCQTLIQRLHQASSSLYNRHRMRKERWQRRWESTRDAGAPSEEQSCGWWRGCHDASHTAGPFVLSEQPSCYRPLTPAERERSSIRLLSNFVTKKLHMTCLWVSSASEGLKFSGLILSPHEGNSSFCSLLSYLWSWSHRTLHRSEGNQWAESRDAFMVKQL